MASFIERAPAEAVVVSIDQVPPVPPEIDQLVGVPEPDSNELLGARLALDAGTSRRKNPDGIDAARFEPPTFSALTPPADVNPNVNPSLVVRLPCAEANAE